MLPLRVAHVVHSLDVGGVETGILNVASRLTELGLVQGICCLSHQGSMSDQVPPGVALLAPAIARQRRLERLWKAAAGLRRFRPDVVHARNCGAWQDGAAAWLLAGCPGHLVASLHGLGAASLDRRNAVLFRLLAMGTARLAAVSQVTALEFAATTRIDVNRIAVLHSGVDTQRFRPAAMQELMRTQQPLVVGCVARLSPGKGHDTLIKAFAMAKTGLSSQTRLLLIGDGPARADLKALVQTLGLAASVDFAGERADVSDQLRRLDVFVLASRHEGRPTSIMEAMATGLPVIAANVGAVADLVVEDRTGLLVAPGDTQALSQAMVALLEDAPRRRTMGAAARRMAEAAFTLEGMAARYAEFYRCTCESRNRGGRQEPGALVN